MVFCNYLWGKQTAPGYRNARRTGDTFVGAIIWCSLNEDMMIFSLEYTCLRWGVVGGAFFRLFTGMRSLVRLGEINADRISGRRLLAHYYVLRYQSPRLLFHSSSVQVSGCVQFVPSSLMKVMKPSFVCARPAICSRGKSVLASIL